MTPQEIAQLRRDLNWSLTDFAFHFRVSAMTVSNWEHGMRKPDLYKTAAIQQLRYQLDQMHGRREYVDHAGCRQSDHRFIYGQPFRRQQDDRTRIRSAVR